MAITLTIIVLLIYFLPSLVGHKKKNANAICILNLLLGWTLIGWIAALVWAATDEPKAAAAAQLPHSSADEISKLADLKSRGIISEAEFESKKKKLLA
jgi:Superinfection immunity protein/Short C-terminal domain